jgi:GTPase SAR1 family protein
MKIQVSTNAVVAKNVDALVRLSYDVPAEQLVIVVHGQAGSGKTTSAASLSKHWPKTGLPTSKATKANLVLDDLYWISFDLAATVGFRERGISVPEFSVPSFIADKKQWIEAGFKQTPSLKEAMTTGLQCLAATAAKGKTKWAVVDTISTLDRDVLLDEQFKTEDGRRAYGELYTMHMSFHYALRRLGLNVCYLSHSKYITEPVKTNPEAHANRQKQAVVLSAGSPDVVPAISGQGQGVYINDASFMFGLVAKEPKPGEFSRRLIVNGAKAKVNGLTYATKCRYELSLDAEEPADLGAMLKKCGLT